MRAFDRHFWLFAILCILALPLAAGEVLTLDEAYRTALKNSPSYLSSRRSVISSDNRQLLVRAGFMPSVSSELSYKRSTLNSAPSPWLSDAVLSTMSGDKQDSDSFNNYSLSFTLSQTIWDFKTYDNYRSADHTLQSARLDAENAANSLFLSVVQAYFAVISADASVILNRESVSQMEKRFETAKAQVENGVRTPVDSLRAEADLASARLNFIKAKNTREMAVKNLAAVIGLTPDTPLEITPDATVEDVPAGDIGPLTEQALSHRPDYRSVKEKMAASRLSLAAVSGDYYPQFKANAGFSYGGYEFDALKYNWYVGASMSWNLFNGLSTTTQRKDAENSLAILELSLRSIELSIRYELEQALVALREAREKMGPVETLFRAAKSALELADQRFNQGLGTITEVSDAQVFYQQAATTRTQALCDLEVAKARVRKALGTGGASFRQHTGE